MRARQVGQSSYRLKLYFAFVQEARLGKQVHIDAIGQADVLQVWQWFAFRIIGTIDLRQENKDDPCLFYESLKGAELL
jgi:hypothetical protein